MWLYMWHTTSALRRILNIKPIFFQIDVGKLRIILISDFSLRQNLYIFKPKMMQTNASNRYIQGINPRRGIELTLSLSAFNKAQIVDEADRW
jgi:hypothetical protein